LQVFDEGDRAVKCNVAARFHGSKLGKTKEIAHWLASLKAVHFAVEWHGFADSRIVFLQTKKQKTMNDFQGYEKMPDSIRKLGLDLADTKLLETVEWVVTEKIHGANFSFIFSADDTLKYAKRKDYLRWADDFFGFQIVAERLG
jgi:hypothetical protein